MIHLIKQKIIILLCCLFSVTNIHAKELISPHCEPLVSSQLETKVIPYAQGLLWKISKKDKEPSYLFGTIHISDKDVTTLPEIVDKALHNSEQFVMEALPDTEQMLLFSKMMFFHDGQRLSELIDNLIYKETKLILSAYQLGPDAVSVMKPWAAFLLMNYPPDVGDPLDLVLLSLAQQNGAIVSGLETLKEQAEIFSDLEMPDQIKLLTDTVCHYDVIEGDFIAMKSYYLKGDLGGLYNYTQRHSMAQEPIYEELMKKLIVDRNKSMVERMQPMLEKGKSFIAIGAMHLPGTKGVLSLLEKKGYRLTAVY
tara:strand:- start:31243 stop:32172 length:930 start_codon:yes stop_codon:yes gene_type:complete